MERLKDSGIEWIGNIPSNWEVKRNKYNFSLDKTLVGLDWVNTQLLSLTKNGVKEINCEEQTGKVPESYGTYQVVEKDDIVMCLFDLDCSAVFSGKSNYNGMISPSYKCFKCKEHMFPQYVDYYYSTVFVDRKYKRYSKNVRFSITADDFMGLPMLVPPLEEQRRIAAFLDDKCSEIKSLYSSIEKQIEVLEEYKKSVITETVTKGLNPNVEMKDSGVDWIGMIPKHWEVKAIKRIGEYRNGLTYSPDDIVGENEGTLVLRSSNVQGGKIVYDDNVYVNKAINPELRIRKGDILICSRNGSRELIGKNAIIDESINASFGAFMMVFRCRCPKFIYYVLNSAVFSYYLGSFFTSTINQLTGSNFGNMKIVFCEDENEQSMITDYLDRRCSEIDAIIESKRKQLEALETYRESLVYEYITGKKEVPSENG